MFYLDGKLFFLQKWSNGTCTHLTQKRWYLHILLACWRCLTAFDIFLLDIYLVYTVLMDFCTSPKPLAIIYLDFCTCIYIFGSNIFLPIYLVASAIWEPSWVMLPLVVELGNLAITALLCWHHSAWQMVPKWTIKQVKRRRRASGLGQQHTVGHTVDVRGTVSRIGYYMPYHELFPLCWC